MNKEIIFGLLFLLFCKGGDVYIDTSKFDCNNTIAFEKTDFISAFGEGKFVDYICVIKATTNAKPIRLTSGKYRECSPRWSYNEDELYFLQEKEDFEHDGIIDKTLYKLDFSTGKIILVIPPDRLENLVELFCICEKNDRDLIVFQSDYGGDIYYWEDDRANLILSLTEIKKFVNSNIKNFTFFSLDDIEAIEGGKLLAFSCSLFRSTPPGGLHGSIVVAYDLTTKKFTCISIDTIAEVASDIAFNPQERYLAYRQQLNKSSFALRIWDAATGKIRTILETSDLAWIGWAPDGKHIAYAGSKPGAPPDPKEVTWVVDLNGNVLYGLNFAGEFDWCPR